MSFLRDPDTGHLVHIEQAPAKPHPEAGADYPKWVKAHESHLVRKRAFEGGPENVSTPHFAECHVDRATGEVAVLVHDADEEARAVAEHVEQAKSEDSGDSA